jgi:hypothetical protein
MLTLAIVPLIGCSDGTGPDEGLTGTYALVLVGDIAPPAVVLEGGGQTYTLLADTLHFQENGTAQRTMVVRHVSATTTPADTTYRQVMSLPYERDGRTVTLGFHDECPPNALCIGHETGTLMGPDLRVESQLFWPGGPVLTFRRLP